MSRKSCDIINKDNQIVVIASSTGGPKALMHVLPGLPGNLNAPVLIVQHMPAGFTKSLSARLDTMSSLHVVEAEDGMTIKKGCAYMAKGGLHMELKRRRSGEELRLFDGEPREGVKPCANYLFESLAQSGYERIICVVLTGMGADSKNGIRSLKDSKQIVVVTQNKETCAVYGMPRAIDLAGLTDESVPLDKVAETIIKYVGVMKDGC